MRGHADDRRKVRGRGLDDEEFRSLMREAHAEARRRFIGRPPRTEPELALRTQHAEFGAAAH
ncbi:hypothetical protein [Streptomyces vietnamensis]|uniref:Uncharacterized protein n=1 Tax=Streptomyces vietnamensis TaxID=362257 RepID=A0A0B5I2M5_9ACTN|nr:hypothetical protein [Streptomyces vietnamensis]AJF68395.1 hypothetical protein SVTN_32680 [Streptomyces vietnamensis]